MRRPTIILLPLLLLTGAACDAPGDQSAGAPRPGDSGPAGRAPEATRPEAARPEANRPDANRPDANRSGPRDSDLRGYDTVFVYFQAPAADGGVEGPQVAFPRAVPDTDALAFALSELLAGPTSEDTAAGPYYTWFSGETAGMLHRVTLEDGTAVVDFGDFRSIIPGASTSAGSSMLLGQLEATVFQFPEVQRVEFRIDGSCDAFMGWIQYGCTPLFRTSFTPPEGYRRAVAK